MKSTYTNALNVLEILREVDPTMPIQTAVVFLSVASNEGLSMTELWKTAKISQASCSRNVAALSAWSRFSTSGHDLVVAKEDPLERRRKVVFLTAKGKKLAKRMADTQV